MNDANDGKIVACCTNRNNMLITCAMSHVLSDKSQYLECHNGQLFNERFFFFYLQIFNIVKVYGEMYKK